MIKLIVGLGNPGPEYEQTRHNIGFWWVDGAARALGVRLSQERAYQGLAARSMRDGAPIWLLQPQTYMNLSGQSVAALARFFKIAPEQILVVHDELDLPPGQMRLKQGGGHAGHNGLRDIIARLGAADFWRLRLGIGHPGVREEVADYVLRKPPAAEREALDRTVSDSLAQLDALLAGRMAQAMMTLHAKPARPKPPRPAAAEGRNTPAAAAATSDSAARPQGTG